MSYALNAATDKRKPPALGDQIYQQAAPAPGIPIKNTFIDFPASATSPHALHPPKTTPAWLAPVISTTLRSAVSPVPSYRHCDTPTNWAEINKSPTYRVSTLNAQPAMTTIKLTDAVPNNRVKISTASSMQLTSSIPTPQHLKKGLLGDPPGSPVYKQNLNTLPTVVMPRIQRARGTYAYPQTFVPMQYPVPEMGIYQPGQPAMVEMENPDMLIPAQGMQQLQQPASTRPFSHIISNEASPHSSNLNNDSGSAQFYPDSCSPAYGQADVAAWTVPYSQPVAFTPVAYQ